MRHTDINSNILIITVTLTIVSTLGVYVVIRKIIQYTRPPVNTLVRSGDIELVDYIEPTRPQEIYNYPDLLGSYYQTYESFSNYGRVSSYWSGNPPSYLNGPCPSYQSGTLPSYQSVNRGYINCYLENSINLDFILWLILFFIVILLIRKYWIYNNFLINCRYIIRIMIIFSIYYLLFYNSTLLIIAFIYQFL